MPGAWASGRSHGEPGRRGDAEEEGRSFGWKEWRKLQKGNEQMEAKERIDVEKRLMEVQGGGKSLLLHNNSPSLALFLSLSHSLAFYFSHSDMN